MMFFDSPWSMSQDLVDLIESSQLGFHGGIFIVDNLRLQFGLMNIQKLHARMSSHCLKEKHGRGLSLFKAADELTHENLCLSLAKKEE